MEQTNGIEELLKLNQSQLIEDYLGYDEVNKIIEKIISNPELTQKVKTIAPDFWEQAQKKGLIMFSQAIPFIYQDQKDEEIDARYIDEQRREKMPTLVYKYKKSNGINFIK